MGRTPLHRHRAAGATSPFCRHSTRLSRCPIEYVHLSANLMAFLFSTMWKEALAGIPGGTGGRGLSVGFTSLSPFYI